MTNVPWTLRNIPDQTGRVAVITGATSGTGFETATAFREHSGPSGFQEFKGDPVQVQSHARSHEADLQQRLWRCSELSTGIVYAI